MPRAFVGSILAGVVFAFGATGLVAAERVRIRIVDDSVAAFGS